MSMISDEDIKNVAHLARLGIESDEASSLKEDLKNILTFVEKMNDVDCTSIQPMAHPFDAHQPQREDIVTETDQREQLQTTAIDVQAGLYIVPQFVDAD